MKKKSSNASKVLKCMGLAAAAGLGVSMVRAATVYTPDKLEQDSALPPENIDVDRFVKNLSKAISIPTISDDDDSLVDWSKFDEFHEFLKEAYPLIHEKLDLQLIAGQSLMYHWKSAHPEKEPIALLAHQDVVPVSPGTEGDWEHDAFSGDVADGFVWGRGALDIKNQLIGIMEAVEALLSEGYVPERDVYLCFGHNEEIMANGEKSGAYCMMKYFKDNGIKLDSVIDEGGAILPVNIKGIINKNLAGVGVAEKGHVDFEISVFAKGGHSSQPADHNAIGELSKIVLALENNQFKGEISPSLWELFNKVGRNTTYPVRVVASNLFLLKPLVKKACTLIPPAAAMMRTTTAVTMASGSPAPNVLPQKASIVGNFRIMPGETIADVEKHIRKYAGKDAEIRLMKGNEPSGVSPTDSRAFKAIEKICKSMDPNTIVAPYLVMGGTDSRQYEPVCENIYRYSPYLVDTSLLLTTHGTNERIPIDAVSDGVAFFKRYIRELTKD